jgi:hypothetical protein
MPRDRLEGELFLAVAQGIEQLTGGLRTSGGINRQHGFEERNNPRRDARGRELIKRDRILNLAGVDFLQGTSHEWGPSAEHIPERHPEGVDVRARIDPPLFQPGELLRAGECRRADKAAVRVVHAQGRLRADRFRQAPVDDFDDGRSATDFLTLVRREHDVRWLQVPVHDAAGFSRRQRPGHLCQSPTPTRAGADPPA